MEYIKENPIIDINDDQKISQLIGSIISTREELNKAHKNFEYAKGDLIDFYTYQIKATRAKLDYLIKKAKTKGLALDTINQIQIKYNEAI